MKKMVTILIICITGVSGFQAQNEASGFAQPLIPKSLPAGQEVESDGVDQNKTSVTLSIYFEIAAENNPGLQSKYKEFEAALQKIPQVNALPDPSFSFGYFISPVETRVGPQRAKLSLSQMFPWFGTLRAKGDAAMLMAEAKYQAFLEARNKLYFDVAAAYFPLYELQQLQEIEQKNIKILESFKTIATRKFENGAAPMVDVLRVDIMLKDSRTNFEILKEKEHALVSTFNSLLNRDENEQVIISDTLLANPVDIDEVKDTLLVRNPAINKLNLQTRASKTSEIVAQKQGLPNFGVGLDYVIVAERSDIPVADNGKDALMPMVSVSIPLFRKKYDAAKKEAQLMQESYTLQKENVLNLLSSEFDQTMFEISQQLELLKLYRDQVAITRQSLNLLFSSYGNSGKEFEEVLRMQQKLLQYEKLMAKAVAQYHTALAKLDYITAKNTNNE